jgi:hypothetical protein
MPHSVFFKGGAAIHATTSLGRLGTAASHGCVRLAPANAETFYKLVSKHGLAMTRVVVTGKAPVYEDRIARSQQPRVAMGNSGYQPVRVASNRGMVFPGDGYARTSYTIPANRTPYWAR